MLLLVVILCSKFRQVTSRKRCTYLKIKLFRFKNYPHVDFFFFCYFAGQRFIAALSHTGFVCTWYSYKITLHILG